MLDEPGEQRDVDGPADRLFRAGMWVAAVIAVLVVIGIVFFIVGLGLGEGDGLGF